MHDKILACAEEEQEADAPDPYARDDPEIAEYKRKHRNMRKNWELPASFPDQRVIEAYRKASTPCATAACIDLCNLLLPLGLRSRGFDQNSVN